MTGLRTTRRGHRSDSVLLLCVAVLMLLGLIIIYSISPVLSHKLFEDVNRNYFLYGQLTHIAAGVVVFLITSNFYWENWQKWLPWLVVLSGFSLLLLLIPALSVSKNGATRWVDIGFGTFQPAEVVKFTLAIGLASYLSRSSFERHPKNHNRALWPIMALLGVLVLLVVFLQRDLGTMLVMAAMVVGVFFASGAPLRQLGILLGGGLGLGWAAILLFPHRLARIATFLNPGDNISTSGYHLNQALIAIGSGGLFGLGVGKSVQVFGYLPEAANDSIFAIIGESFGLAGAIVVLLLFGVFIQRGFKIALSAPTRFARLLVVGVTLWVGSQAIINIFAMLGLVPLTGIPLPFLSYGGTSMVAIMAAIGIVVNISKYTQKGQYENSAQRRRNGRTRYAHPSYYHSP